MPGGQEAGRLLRVDAGGILREVALLGEGIQTGKECQALIGNPRHDMALAFQGPEFEGQTGPQGVLGGDHLRAGKAGGLGQFLGPQAHQIGQEQEQAPATGGELARGQGELADVGHRFDRGPGGMGPLLIQASGQGRRSLRL